jgi:hypothetical protein
MSTAENTFTTPVRTDTRLAELYVEAQLIGQQITMRLADLHLAAGDRRTRHGRTSRWGMTDTEVLNLNADTLSSWDARTYTRISREYHDLVERTNTIAHEMDDLDAIYAAAGGWSRFFIVTNPGGHIHRTAGYGEAPCSTCYPTTQYRWLPEISGLTEADAVAKIGPRLCSVCFPSAPVEHRDGELHATREERETRQADRKKTADAKLAKRLDACLFEGDPDRFIKVDMQKLATTRAARTWLKDGFEWSDSLADGRKHHACYPPESGYEVAEAVAARTGSTIADVLEDAEKRAQPAIRRNRKAADEFRRQYNL